MLVKNKALALSLSLAGTAWLASLPALAGDYGSKGGERAAAARHRLQGTGQEGEGYTPEERWQEQSMEGHERGYRDESGTAREEAMDER